jgi:MFS family permease
MEMIPKSLGFILGARVLAAVLFSPVTGVWSDRFPRVQVMITADLFRAATCLLTSFLGPTRNSLLDSGDGCFLNGNG